MAAQIYSLNIQGYWRDGNKSTIPMFPGIFFVYEAAYDSKFDSINLHRLIYIGESDNVRDKIYDHPKYGNWLNHVRYGNELCYALAYVESIERSRIKAALVNKHKPIENEEFKNSFRYDTTTIKTTGDTNLLSTEFKVFEL